MPYLFDPGSTASIAILTNTRFTMSSKAGSEIKARFGGTEWLVAQGVGVGNMLAVQHNVPGNPQGIFYVYYLVISARSSTSHDEDAVLVSSLDAMITHAVANGVTEIRIALDKRRYSIRSFRAVVDTAFSGSDVTPTVINASSSD